MSRALLNPILDWPALRVACLMLSSVRPRIWPGDGWHAERWISAAFGVPSVCAGPPRISLAVVVFSCLSRTAYHHACAHMASPARAAALPRIQEFGVGLIYHVRLTPARSRMAGLCLACRSSDAVQKVFKATVWLRSQGRVRHSSGKQGRPSPSDLHQCIEREVDLRPGMKF